MRQLILKKRGFTAALLGISFALLLGFQVTEASHLHVHAVDFPDCLQCQVDAPAAFSDATHAQTLAVFAARVDTLYQSLSLNTPYSLSSPRGPPTFSS